MTAAKHLSFRLAVGLLTMGCVLFDTAPTFGQAERPVVRPEGSQAFRHILKQLFHCTSLSTVADLQGVPWDRTLVIVLGDTRVLGEVAVHTEGLTNFRARGGAVLIATDSKDDNRLKELGIHVDGRAVQQVPEQAYVGEPRCPLVTKFLDRQHVLFTGLTEGIATNVPSFLVRDDGCDLDELASLSGELSVNGGLWSTGHDYLFMVGSAAGGRVLVLADPDVFTNQMLVNRDNYLFAVHSVLWLTEGGRRKHVLFLEDGKVQPSFEVPLTEVPAPPIPPAEIVNRLLAGLEQENVFNRLLLDSVGEANLIRILVLGLTGLLVLYLLRRLARARHRVDAHLPLVAHKAALALAAPPLPVLRGQALLRSGNLWETARQLARECFEIQAGAVVEAARTPRLTITGGWWQRRRLGRLTWRLWDLAYGTHAVRVSPRQLQRLQTDIERLRAALETRVVVFHEDKRPQGAERARRPGE